MPAPAIIDFEYLNIAPDIRQFTVRDTGVAVLLEGRFTSAYKNRVSGAQREALAAAGQPYLDQATQQTQMIVVADGDIAMNQFSQLSGPLAMGENLFTHYTYANKEFYNNSLEYLLNPSGILETRAKNFTLRLLDPVKTRDQKTFWQLINIAVPILLVLLSAVAYQVIRKRQYTRS